MFYNYVNMYIYLVCDIHVCPLLHGVHDTLHLSKTGAGAGAYNDATDRDV